MTTGAPQDIDFHKYSLLIIDDNATNLGVIVDYLEAYGFEIMVARSGEVGLRRARYAQPSLILLDVMMSGIDGFETCQRLKANVATAEIPVIFMTALSSSEDKVRGFEVGAVDYVTKPIQQDEVLARITTHLRIRDLTQHLQQQTGALQQANNELAQTLNELRATQQQLLEAKKMAALGRLVAGVAHEINTPIGIGVTAASTLQGATKSIITSYTGGGLTRSELSEYLEVSRKGSQLLLDNLKRASDLVQSFKQVAVDQVHLEKRRFNLKNYLKSTLRSLAPRLEKARHTLEIQGDEHLSIESYPGAFSQVVTNLVMNSLTHAYREGEVGHLHFELIRQEQTAILTYSDDGRGIPEKHLVNVFDPFFTTARHRGGTGLGLHIVYNLVTQRLSGTIHCKSEMGKGTAFIIRLPLS